MLISTAKEKFTKVKKKKKKQLEESCYFRTGFWERAIGKHLSSEKVSKHLQARGNSKCKCPKAESLFKEKFKANMIGGEQATLRMLIEEVKRRGRQESNYIRPYSQDKEFKFCFESDRKPMEGFK